MRAIGSAGDPFLLLRAMVDADACERWSAVADRGIAAGLAGRTDATAWSATSSSLRLGAVIDFSEIRAFVWRGPLRSACTAALGTQVACDLDQCWLRRQFAAAHAPPLHRPHAWHQDGALGFDFGSVPSAFAHGLLEMLTCWIALAPCGIDAPGLELVAEPQDRVLTLVELDARTVDRAYPPDTLRRPALATGDALLFTGGIVHRTHVTPQMACDRTSLELRFFAAGRIPGRLAADRFELL